MDRLAGLEVFVAVADSGSFSKAARKLRLSTSTVSKHISTLEERLGVRLLNRTTRRVSLTEIGAAYRERAARVLAELEEADNAASQMQSEPRGTLRVNAPMSFGILHLAPAVVEFMRAHPQVSLDITLNDRFVDLIDEGYDVAIRIGRLEESSMIARKILVSRTILCAAPDYLARHGTPKTLADLTAHDCMLYSHRRPVDRWTLVGPEGDAEVAVGGSLIANNGDILRTAALAGQGIGMFPTFIVGQDLRQGRLARVLPDYAEAESNISALYPSNRQLSAKVRLFIDFLVERFGPEPDWDRE